MSHSKLAPLYIVAVFSGLTQLEVDAYNAPFPTEQFKAGARQFPVLVPSSKEDPARKNQLAAWEVLKKWEKTIFNLFF